MQVVVVVRLRRVSEVEKAQIILSVTQDQNNNKISGFIVTSKIC